METPKPPEYRETAGQEFVRRIRPAGCALFLALFVLMLALCFSSARKPIPGYEPPESMEYYAENPDALAAELTENVIPALDYTMTAEAGDGVVTVTVYEGNFVSARAAILRYFDQALFVFEQG